MARMWLFKLGSADGAFLSCLWFPVRVRGHFWIEGLEGDVHVTVSAHPGSTSLCPPRGTEPLQQQSEQVGDAPAPGEEPAATTP